LRFIVWEFVKVDFTGRNSSSLNKKGEGIFIINFLHPFTTGNITRLYGVARGYINKQKLLNER